VLTQDAAAGSRRKIYCWSSKGVISKKLSWMLNNKRLILLIINTHMSRMNHVDIPIGSHHCQKISPRRRCSITLYQIYLKDGGSLDAATASACSIFTAIPRHRYCNKLVLPPFQNECRFSKKNCFKINVTFSFQCTINYLFPTIPLNYSHAHYFQSTTFYFNL